MAFLSYIIRFTLQHRALYCYLLLSLWILILLGVMYKYIGIENEALNLKHHTTEIEGPYTASYDYFKNKKISQACNPYQEITIGSEEGVIILIRHGDRGPLTHVQNISNVNCVGPYNPLYASFDSYIKNITGTPALSQLLGTFHGVPVLPVSECSLGLLTKIGASQLLATGKILSTVYRNLLINSTKQDIKAFSTRYRRTLQSALAFLYSFLDKNEFQKLTLQEAPSLAFCFDDCACPSADLYQKRFSAETYRHIRSHPAVLELVKATSNIVYDSFDKKVASDPHALKDAILTYVCHNAQLPCQDQFHSDTCVKTEHITSLFTYLEWEYRQFSKSQNLKKLCLLRAYGFIKNIVSQLLQIVSEKKPKLVLYSGHDKTISYLAIALGVNLNNIKAPHYASRLIFEVYRTQNQPVTQIGPIGSDYFFRLLFNGLDITHKIKFCKNLNFSTKKLIFNLCPIESIVRYLHDDYFALFNATNIKDACSL